MHLAPFDLPLHLDSVEEIGLLQDHSKTGSFYVRSRFCPSNYKIYIIIIQVLLFFTWLKIYICFLLLSAGLCILSKNKGAYVLVLGDLENSIFICLGDRIPSTCEPLQL